ncbi:hypothetical protein NCCP28_14140 [Niallia sp. NCCP-28]|nr:hypothetical protein NCCP28_14140 [Niallia sp. NCCP-28]
MYSDAPDGYKVASIHFFGVKYASFIQENHLSVREIIKASGLNTSYATEISKGIKLSKYVVPK